MKKLLLLIMVVSFAGAAGGASVWTRPTVDGPGNWNDLNNWNTYDAGTGDGGVPTSLTNVVRTATNAANLAEMQVTDAQTFGQALRHGYNEDVPTTVGPLLRITGAGDLSQSGATPARSYVGYWSNAQMIVEAGGVFSTSHRLYLGHKPGAIGTVNVFGTVNVDSNKTYVGNEGTGFLNIIGDGVYNARGFESGRFEIGPGSIVDLIGGGKLVTDGDDLTNAEALIAGGRIAGFGVAGAIVTAAYDPDTDQTTITATDPMVRTPAYGAEVSIAVSSDVDLSWVNLDPNEVGGNVWVDVWFGTDMTLVQNASDPNIWEYADFDKVVDAGENTTGVTVSAPGNGQEYFWRVDTYRYGNPATDPDTPLDEGIAMPFTVNSDFPPTIVIDSPSMITWVGGPPIHLTATVTDEGTSEIIIEWDSGNESEPNIIFSNETWDPETKIATADVIVDYATNNFNVRVRATDAVGTYRFAHLVLQCRADACDAARWLNGQLGLPQGPPADVNDDCEFDLLDVAVLALDWLYDYTILVPTPIAP